MKLSRICCPLSVGVLTVCLSLAPAEVSGQWSERTELTFSDPVMIPGATLQPGTYVFQLMDPGSAGDIIEIRKKDGTLITTTITVPTKRPDAKGDNVLKFNPTEEGTPPALAAWFYPGTIYGHQFVYPDEQAKKIAQRTKTVVLSTDVPGTDLEKATVRVYDASGMAKAWTPDPDVMASWQQWSRNRRATANVVTEKAMGERGRATAPMVDAEFQGTRVEIDDLEENPRKYTGKTISVDAEVEEVFGPRLFTIDERNWGDLDGELLVFVPTPLAAVVRDDDRITVTGMVKPFVEVALEKEWGWLGLDKELEADLSKRSVLVASRIVGGNNNAALVVNTKAGTTSAVGTSGSTAAASTGRAAAGMVKDLGSIANADEAMVGRSVELHGVAVHAMSKDRGFFAKAGNNLVFVLPMADAALSQGQTVSVEGIALAMPRHMRDKLNAPAGDLNEDIYIYAMRIHR
jgi:hypothetical protein